MGRGGQDPRHLEPGQLLRRILDALDLKAEADRKVFEKLLAKAKAEGTDVKAICVINPGNPTGAVLDEANIAMIRAHDRMMDRAINTFGRVT